MRSLKAYAVAVATLATSLSFAASASEVVWDQNSDVKGAIGPIHKTISDNSANWEVADDFNVTAKIDKLTIQPLRSYPWSAPPPINGVTVRFYSWNNGSPGTLQAEHFVQKGSPLLDISTSWQIERISVGLPVVFNATGRHFVSFQVHTDEPFNVWTDNTGSVSGSPAKIRNRNAGSTWTSASIPEGSVDAAIFLEGIWVGTPVINSMSHSTIARSDRLVIRGDNFGGTVPEVIIDGKKAILAGWNQHLAKAYIPETTSLGTVSVKVITDNGITAEKLVNVTERKPEGRINWKFRIDNAYTQGVPVVSPDGSIYVNDGYAIYGLTANGALKFIFGQAAWFDRIDVGPDGTLYTSCNDEIFAINPDGSLKWKYDPPFDGNWPNSMGGPNVGPDGNIYVAHVFEGIYSLNPQGQLRWKYPHKVSEYKPTSLKIGFFQDQAYFSIGHEDNGTVSPFMQEILVLGLDGKFRWRKTYVSSASPAVSPLNGDVYALHLSSLTALTKDGAVKWQQSAYVPPIVGNDGTLYGILNAGLKVFAQSPNGSYKWIFDQTDHWFEPHAPSPNNSVVMGGGSLRFSSHPSDFRPYLQALSPTGALLWRQNIPNENTYEGEEYSTSGYILPGTPAYSADSSTAYFPSFHNADYGHAAYTYLYAVSTGQSAPVPPSTFVSQQFVTSMVAGQSYSVRIVMKNTGQTAWTAGTHFLQAQGSTGTQFSRPRIDLKSGETVEPGETKTFSFTVYAPMNAGTYPIQYRMATASGAFGDPSTLTNVAVSVKYHGARYLTATVPTTVKAGQSFTVSVKMRNVGTGAWSTSGGYSLVVKDPDFNTLWSVSQVPMLAGETINRGADKVFSFTVKAPTTPGNYRMRWQMHRDSSSYTGFFGDKSAFRNITVTP